MFIKLNMMEKFILKHLNFIMFLMLMVGVNQAINAQQIPSTNSMDWQFDCVNPSEVEIIGTGTQIAGNPPIVINIPNYSTADSILLEIVYRLAYTYIVQGTTFYHVGVH